MNWCRLGVLAVSIAAACPNVAASGCNPGHYAQLSVYPTGRGIALFYSVALKQADGSEIKSKKITWGDAAVFSALCAGVYRIDVTATVTPFGCEFTIKKQVTLKADDLRRVTVKMKPPHGFICE